MKFSTILAPTSALLTITAALSVDFFYTVTNNTCSYEHNTIIANQVLIHGGICGYQPDTARIYGCPAPDPTCWTWNERCAGAGGTTGLAGAQVTCNRAGTVWCCNALAGERCTTMANQINVCISNFTSPNAGVSIADANAKYQSVIGIAGSSISATSQTKDPTPFTTVAYALSTSMSSLSITSMSSSTSTTASRPASTANSTSTTSPTLAPMDTGSVSSGLSGGAIGGIAAGIVVVIVLAVVGAILYFMRRRKRNRSSQRVSQSHTAEMPAYTDSLNTTKSTSAVYASHMAERSQQLRYGGHHAASQKETKMSLSELDGNGNRRVEMSGETLGAKYEVG